MKKVWCVHTVEYYSALKKKAVLPLITTGMNLQDIMLSEISQAEKGSYCMISLICGI